MDARRARIVACAIFATSLAIPIVTSPVAAAECTLSARAYANVGTQQTIEGAGFPASASVDIEISVQDGGSDEFSVQSDAAGHLEISLTPETIDLGVTTVRASAGSTCTASVTYTVLAAVATPPPAPAEPPSDSSGTGGEPAPRTDAALGFAGTIRQSGNWAFGLILIALGGLGHLVTRTPRRRQK